VGVEDVVAVKALEFGLVPPIANIQEGFEPDPELGDLNLSHGGKYPLQYSLRLGAGFGSQIALSLLRKIAGQGERVDKDRYSRWLSGISGYASNELEIVQRTLRIKNQGASAQKPAASRWQFGQGPTLFAVSVQTAPDSLAQPVVPALPQEQPQPAAMQAVIDDEEIKTYVLAAVSQKTGYPVEVLDLELDLEADLGIDTVKQAELFAAIRSQYGIARREDLRLSDYNTLAKVIGFVRDSLGAPIASSIIPESTAQPAASLSMSPVPLQNAAELPVGKPEINSGQQVQSPQPQPAMGAGQASLEEIKAYVLGAVSQKTGYPVEVLDLDLDL
jgi:hypothetical protein